LAQEENVIVQSMVQAGLSPAEAQARYALDLEARALQERLRREEPSFAGMYGDASSGSMRIFVRLTGNAQTTLARFTSNPAFVAVQAAVPLQALERRQAAMARALEARGVAAGTSIDLKTGKVRVYTRQPAQARQALTGVVADTESEVREDDAAATPVAAVSGGRQTTYQSVSGTTLSSDRGTLGFAVTNGTTSGVTTAAHFGRCVNASGATIAGCTVNGPSFYNPANTTGQLTGTPSLRWQSERLGGAYDVEWRTSTTDTFPNQIIYGASTVMAVTSTYDPANLVIGSSRVCKQGFTTGYACGTLVERYNQLWFGTYGDHYLVSSDSGGMMASGGDSGGPVFLANTAVGLISGVFQNTSSSRYGQMSFTSITTLSALGIRVKTAP
jgi:hypothetical protein